ncbi:MAG: 16S rRNA (uracil(1498)-N(3))-methyltransferase [Ruminococcus sp.]|nr:16S rRNA (uracil(1498)-N(3))-methyltransferase [Ruminococcus sp.]
MHHFFIEPSQIQDGVICVEGADVNHIKNVLRMKPGGQVMFGDGTGVQYLCALESTEPVRFRILDFFKEGRELPSRICLFQGIPKGDKMDLVIQKATELGASDIYPVSTSRTVVKLDAKKAEKKVARWQGIAEASAKQCGRSKIPFVHEVTTFPHALITAGELDVLLIPYERAEGMEDTRRAVEEIRPGQSVGIFIGPEGGFEETEVGQAVSKGASPVTLGKRILRTETAGLVILSILLYHLE